ncbi:MULTISPECIES: hypothetical protein [unclassified Pseudomonas]|uniref:hypothetical protein n=1 Tax=unclassified Pseudomonas TaxID=196821 RepID=UPI0002A280C2|nr:MULTISPECIES: hypothetical protein [unclassified Pseudomonas]NTX88196.1 hypothetical protein [Pseudomonas sp. UMA643]NTY18769.1 hypothetical protein [Pseudomonas sp. UMC3103]NTY23927.1 hypothetical protein [Pseudomonas sp. UMA603]NTY29226.1 hypothetical protein [Pseudomonas sp. UMC3129]NTY53426.1 hypothetical protein [Pseudomonas sp. UMC631]
MAYTPFNTGNPIGTWGSVDPRDLVDNAAILDRWVNDQTITQWRDRFGVQRLTWNGMEVAFQQAQDDRQSAFDDEQAEHQADFDAAQAQRESDFNAFLLASGYQFIGDYDTDGPLTITQVNQIFSKDGEFWRAGAALTLPYTTVNDWEVDEANFVSVGDAALRQELAEDDGANKVGWSRHSLSSAIANVHQALDAQAVSVWEFAGLVMSKPTADPATWDWAPAFQAAVDYADTHGIDVVEAYGSFGLGASVTIPAGVLLRGRGRRSIIIPLSTGSFTGGYCFLLNNNGSIPTVAFPNNLSGGISGFWFQNNSQTASRRAVLYSGSMIIENLRGSYMTSMVKSLGSGAYSDNSRIRGIHSEPVISSEYQVDLQGLGDSANIGDLHFPRNGSSTGLGADGNTNGLSVQNSLGFNVNCVIGGNIRVRQAVGGFYGLHLELSRIALQSSSITIADSYLCPKTDWTPIVCTNDTGIRGSLRLCNVEFARMYGLSVRTGYDIELDTHWSLYTENVHRRHLAVDNISNGTHTGITVCKKDGSALLAFNKFSFVYSGKGAISQNYMVTQEAYSETRALTPTGLLNTLEVTVSGVTTSLSGTYYYNSQVLLDSTRLVGRATSGGEKSGSTTNNIIGLSTSLDNAQNVILRMYRGTSSGNYDSVVDIPMMGSGVLYDDGISVNGYAWNSRTAGGMDTLNSIGEYSLRGNSDGSVLIKGQAAPTTGTWLQGDQIDRTSNLAAGGKRSRICVAGGSPGTWKDWGAIDA